MHVDIKGQPEEVGSLLLPCEYPRDLKLGSKQLYPLSHCFTSPLTTFLCNSIACTLRSPPKSEDNTLMVVVWTM